MPKHRRRKNQRKNKGNNNSNKQTGKQQQQQDRQPGGEELGKSNEGAITTGNDPEIETVDHTKAEYTQTIERSLSTGSSADESKIADAKLNASDSDDAILRSQKIEKNFGNFSDSCPVTKSLKNDISSQTSKTGAKISTEQKAEGPSPQSPRELVEIRKVINGQNQDVHLHKSPTSDSLSSSDSDTLKADGDSPDREIPNVLENESREIHDVTTCETANEEYAGSNPIETSVCISDESMKSKTATQSLSLEELKNDEYLSKLECTSEEEVYRSPEECKNALSSSSLEGFDDFVENQPKPIKHSILQEVITTLYSYRVESPKPITPNTVKVLSVKKSRSLDDDDDVMIQEISDNSSAGDLTDNQPVISEAESEAETPDPLPLDEQNDSRILSITTIPLDSIEAENIRTQEFTSSKDNEKQNDESQDIKSRRAKKRAALETHFMPQFLNPRYLDSIKEENSDTSDHDKKSDRETLSQPGSPFLRDFAEDIFADSSTIAKKTNAVFPKSNLDFSHKHKPVSHLRTPKTDIIREESPCVVVEAKIVEQESVEESCSTWTMDKIQESGAAEIVYLDSASSSSSDLLDLDYSQGNDADIEDLNDESDIRIQTPTIQIDEEAIFKRSTVLTSEKQENNKQPSENGEKLSASLTPVVYEKRAADEIIIENSTKSCDHRRIYEQSASGHNMAVDEKSLKNNSEEVLSDQQLNSLVDSGNCCTNNSTNSECNQLKTDFKVGEPCSSNMFASLLSPLISDKKNTENVDSVELENLDENNDFSISNKELTRQDSSGSHASGQSQSTVHSQCTAINKDSLTYTDVADFADVGSCISGSSNAVNSLETSEFKTLRQICLEALASMPYGRDILEELASVAESLSHLTQEHQERKYQEEFDDMPYPIPDLPRIEDLEIPAHQNKSGQQLSHVKIMAVPPPPKTKSPAPPPIPELPKESSWLGLPTEQDPNILVCLSPSQRSYLKETKNFTDNSADTLLDMHKKFIERRGYHELTTEQVNAMQREKSKQIVSSTQLRNSVTPPPIPPPPSPQLFIENETVTATNLNDDKNNHRLLAIIRDSKQCSSENSSRKIEQAEKSEESVSVPKTHRSDQETQTTKTANTTTTTTANTATIGKGEELSEGEVKDNKMTQSYLDRENFFKFSDNENPFKGELKRFSNIETTPIYCEQIMQTIPKRYSNIESSSYESKKRTENGKVVYEFCDSKKEKVTDSCDKEKLEREISGCTGSASSDNNTINTSDGKSKRTFHPTQAPKSQSSEFSQSFKNSKSDNPKITSTNDFSYDEFRRRAKETAKNAKSEFFKRETLLKDFEDIEKIFKDDLFSMNSETTKKESKTYEIPVKFQNKTDMWQELDKKIQQHEEKQQLTKIYENVKSKSVNETNSCDKILREPQNEQKSLPKSYQIPIKIEKNADPWEKLEKLRQKEQQQQRQTEPRVHEIPIKCEKKTDHWDELDKKIKQQSSSEKVQYVTSTIENQKNKSKGYEKSSQSHNSQKCEEKIIPITLEEQPRPASTSYLDQYSSSLSSPVLHEQTLSEKRLTSQNLDEWMKYTDLGASSDNITKPFMKEMEIVYQGKRANIRAPRLSASTSNIHSIGRDDDNSRSCDTHHKSSIGRQRYTSCHSMIDQTPITQYVSPYYVRRSSQPKETSDVPVDYIQHKEQELQAEFDRLEKDRRKLIEEMDKMHEHHRLQKDLYQHRSCRLPTLSEEEAFRQQMHDEWMSKVAEREERRLHKIIKISKASDELPSGAPERPVRKSSSSIDISDEFLKRVKERRSKLQMPSDSDWESGAESQPTQKHIESDTEPCVKVIEGQREADLRHLPKHLREFAELTSTIKEEKTEESSTYTKSMMTKKDDYLQVPENTSQPKLATILRHRATSASSTSTTTTTAKQKKQTRFALSSNRRSWSESDLLKEIDSALNLAKGFLYSRESQPAMITPKFRANAPGSGIWSPAHKSETTTKESRIQRTNSTQSPSTGPTPPPLPVWSPQPSPTPGQKEFRPIKFASPVLPRRYVRQDSAPSVGPPWSYTDSRPFLGNQSSSCSNLNSVDSTKRTFSSSTDIPQKFKDNSVGKGALYNETERPKIPKDNSPGFLRPNEVIYSVKHEYMSEPESENDRPKKMAQLGRRQFEGIGPTTRDGMPIVLRSEVKEPNQHQWYKRMYNTLHKAKDGDEYVTISYKTHRGRYPYKSNGYMSEPEPSYDSDYSTMKYNTLDRRRRTPSTGTFHDDRNYGTMPNPIKSGSDSYKNQPGRIEDYIPGRSSVSEKEKKEWWDEVMDIFNGHLEQQKLSTNYTEGYLSRALKEQGYESDSNLVFRKKGESQFAPLSPVEQRKAYRNVQAGGEPPLQGFRKLAPEKPKDENDIEYYPITSTLTKIRAPNKNALPHPQKEIICYPITNITRPLDLFAPFPKNVISFVPVNPPPAPPSRHSSKISTALKVFAEVKETKKTGTPGRHEACFKSDYFHKETPSNKFGTITIRKQCKKEPLMRSKSAGKICSTKLMTASMKEETSQDSGTHVSRKQQTYRVSSVSPSRPAYKSDLRKSSPSPVAFGRSISKERSFAEEKKRLEETLPLCRRSFTASTNILKDPSLKSPDEVKRAVRSYAQPLVRSKSAPKKLAQCSSTVRLASYLSANARRNITSPGKKEEKSLKMTMSVTCRDPRTLTKVTVKSPSVIKSNFQTSKIVEKKSPRQATKASSTLSLARTSSTFSVDSNGSKKKSESRKQPQTITHSITKERITPRAISVHRSNKPVSLRDICPSKSDSNVLRHVQETVNIMQPEKIVRNIEEIQRDINNKILQHKESVRSDNFFQNLFLRDSSPLPSIDSSVQPSTSVQEKTKYWDTLASKSGTISRRGSSYLSQRRPVSDSKFLSLENKRFHQSRSLSPSYRTRGPHVLNKVIKFDSYYQLSDEESEFGAPGHAEEIIYKFEKKSNSEPRSRPPLMDRSRSNSPPTHDRNYDYPRIFTPTREVRSPSRRRIDSFREHQKEETKKVIRASSLSSADDRSRRGLYECSELSHSASSLNFLERHGPRCRLRNSDKFIDLNRFYNNLERVGQLERATSSTDLRPIRKEGEIIDFDEWRKIRAHEKAEKELSYLVGKLKRDQREKDFLFRPKDVDEIKWHEYSDSGLRCKEKSVEDLRDTFEKKLNEDGLDEAKRYEIEAEKDTYKPFWRGTSVADSASNMVVKYARDGSRSLDRKENRFCLSNRLISTLSKDQVSKIKNQLKEIYSTAPGGAPKDKYDITEDFVITVEDQIKPKLGSLKVRSNSTISKEELLGPVLKRKESQIRATKSESTSRHTLPPRPPFQSKSFDRISKQVCSYETELSEVEKRKLSQSLSREVQDKVLERKNRGNSPVFLARETRGAIAAENAKKTLPDMPPPPPPPQQEYFSIDYSRSEVQKKDTGSRDEKISDRRILRVRRSSVGETESNASDMSKTTVIYKENPTDDVHTKIKYFEEKKEEEPPKTIYHAREYSSPDEEEILKAIEEKIKAKEKEINEKAEKAIIRHQELSSSVSDFKELFGERETSRVNFPLPRPPPPPDEDYRNKTIPRIRSSSLTLSDCSSCYDSLYRSRSVSPGSGQISRSILNRVRTGDVKKIKDKFESLNETSRRNFFELSPLRKVRSDPELNKSLRNPHKITVRDHEFGDVSWITHKFEVKNNASRGRSRTRRVISPIQRVPIRKEDRLMPHIDIISKTAALKHEIAKSHSPSPTRQQPVHTGEVERIRCKFESPDRSSLLGQMYTSSPDISELKDISTYLTGSWIAHKYPRPRDNARSPIDPEKGPENECVKRRDVSHRSLSTSPPRSKTLVTSILKPYYDIFADQKFDPLKHRPKSRYVPDQVDELWKKVQNGFKKPNAVKFEGFFKI